MSHGGTHTPNSRRARERKAKRRQAHAEGKRRPKSTPPALAKVPRADKSSEGNGS